MIYCEHKFINATARPTARCRPWPRIWKYGRANGQGLDSWRPSITEIGVKRTDGPRAQKCFLPPIVGTGAKAFNATGMLPPNLTVIGNVIGERAPVKSPLSQLYPQNRRKVRAGTI
jgi:hypothetical protein